MSRIAIDVILLPDEAMIDKAIEVNARLVKEYDSEIVLSRQDCLPHISLAMGCIDERDVTSIETVLDDIAKENPPGDLTATDIHTSTNTRGEIVSAYEIRKTREVQLLHETVIAKISPYFSFNVTSDMIYPDDEVSETTLQWIRSYREKASFANFFPHITLGYGEAAGAAFPIVFTASKLALCHLGNHCTCRKILASTNIIPTAL